MKKEKHIERSIKKLLAKRNSLLNEVEELNQKIKELKESSVSFEETITITGYRDEYCSECNRKIKIDKGRGEHGYMFTHRCTVYDVDLCYGNDDDCTWVARPAICLKAEKKSKKMS